jgi:GT2 family glycosyltransferase
MASTVTVSVVNFNHERYLPACLEGLRHQSLPPTEVIVRDNASSDGSLQWLRRNASDVNTIASTENMGYAAGHNRTFEASRSDYVLALNCDVALAPDFLKSMTSALESDPTAGSACGRLYRGKPGQTGRLDSTGLFPDRFRRFHDRDHDREDHGQRQIPGYVFGPSGSAAMFRRSMLDDIEVDGQFFDEDFFAYCEDADLAWRAQRRGWTSIFVPEARGWHVHDDMSRARSHHADHDARFRQLLLMRNRHLCFLKNEPWVDLARAAPLLMAYDGALETYLISRGSELTVRWPLSLARQLPRLGRKRAREFGRALRQVHLADWFDVEVDRVAA